MSTKHALFELQTHQPVHIGTDVVHIHGLAIHHEEGIINIIRQGREQLLLVQKLPVLFGQGQFIFIMDKYYIGTAEQKSQQHEHDHGNGLQLIHASVDHIDRNQTHQERFAVLCGHVNEVISLVADGQSGHTLAFADNALQQLLLSLPRNIGQIIDIGMEIEDSLPALGNSGNGNPSTFVDDIVVGRTLKGVGIQGLDQVFIIIANGDGLRCF